MEICEKVYCTGCGACAFVCPKHCISMKEDEKGVLYPVVEDEQCVNCGCCKRTCPQCEKVSVREIITAYAAWSRDKYIRATSASGGIATELYQLALEKNFSIAGAVIQDDFSVQLNLSNDIKSIEKFKNSKYVFSDASILYEELEKCLRNGNKAAVIGLPCQIAAIRKIFKDNPNLLLVDVVCHGTTPTSYLQQHIAMLEEKIGEKANKISFRDPEMYTYTYTFTLYSSDKRIYSQRMKEGDTYQIGYHQYISYRENCYNCIYAQENRISDITLSDYKGLGKMKPCEYDEKNVSCVLVHTKQGATWINELINNRKIIAEKRPIQEPIQADPQLQHPSIKTRARKDFEKKILLNKGDFEKTMSYVVVNEKRRKRIGKFLSPIKTVMRFFRGN